MTDVTRRALAKTGVAVAAAALFPAAAERPRYKDPRVPIPERVADLLGRMTIAEKTGQLMGITPKIVETAGRFDAIAARAALPDGIGHLCSPSLSSVGRPGYDPSRSAAETAAFMNAVQRWAVEGTRLGIPVLAHEEALHGLARRDATSFPQAIGLASSFDPDLLTRVFAVAAAETRARGVHLVLTPVVDVARDPRWGRCEETYGEDHVPVRRDGGRGDPRLPGRHDARSGADARLRHRQALRRSRRVGGGRQHRADGQRGRAHLPRTTAAAVSCRRGARPRRGGDADLPRGRRRPDPCQTAASSPGVLRGEWGFAGITVSDYGSIRELRTIHRVAATDADAAALAMMAGVDVELPDPQTYVHLPALVAAGRVPMARIDEAVARVLTIKFASGLFDAPYVRCRRRRRPHRHRRRARARPRSGRPDDGSAQKRRRDAALGGGACRPAGGARHLGQRHAHRRL